MVTVKGIRNYYFSNVRNTLLILQLLLVHKYPLASCEIMLEEKEVQSGNKIDL